MRITEYEVLGRLPDPFRTEDGRRVCSVTDWERHRQTLRRLCMETQFGTLPPAPEMLSVEPMSLNTPHTYRIHCGRGISFQMTVFLPKNVPNPPAVIDGDLCFRYPYDRAFYRAFTDCGIAAVFFNRTELAPDLAAAGRHGQLYDAYPEYGFGAIGAWAWGYSRCVDALERLGIVDLRRIAFTGHSRGGKTALLAGALDERAAIVNPNDSGCCGSGCHRVRMAAFDEAGQERRSERLSDLCAKFPHWLSPGMAEYIDREAELPFDGHFLKALVAPRILLDGSAVSDIWANPVGTWQTDLAAREVYRFLDAEENLLWYYRPGIHEHHISDVRRLVQVINGQTPEDLFCLPFDAPEPIFDWHCPEKNKKQGEML